MSEIVKTEGVLGGKARVAGRRVSVLQIGEMYTSGGFTAEDIADQLDLSLATVHAALAYYYDHLAEMEASLDQYEELTEKLQERSFAPEELTW